MGRKVVLIDVDMRRPALHAALGIPNGLGLSSFLTSQEELAGVLIQSEFDHLSVITSGPIPPSPTDLLSSPRMYQLIAILSEQFDVVLFDSPPVLGLADAPMLAAMVDAVVLVVQSDRSRRGSLKSTLRRLQSTHAHTLGAVLTMFDASKVGNRYSEYYGYEYYQYRTETPAAS